MSSLRTDQRRSLVFADVFQIMPEVRRLVPAHRTVANWSLGQICEHLARSFVGSMEGFDLSNHRIKRFFLRRKMLHVALTKGIPRDYTVDENLTPPPKVDLREAVGALDAAIQRYQNHQGKLHAHPLFGKMPRDVWDRVHCVHCAHHLSLVLPADG
ncbi:MAG: DUF1569 domain-containing protein [Phycisphaerae bacterium]